MRRIFNCKGEDGPHDNWICLRPGDWRKIRRALRAADKFSAVFSDCQPKKGLIADVCKAIDALNKEPKR